MKDLNAQRKGFCEKLQNDPHRNFTQKKKISWKKITILGKD